LVQAILEHAGKVKLVRAQCSGRNALDFVLACVAGTLVTFDPLGYYHIISKDKGYDALVAHLRSQNIHAARHDAFNKVPIFRAAVAPTTPDRAAQYARHLELVPSHRPARRKTLSSAINTYFARQLPESEVENIVASLISSGTVTIGATGKVDYPPRLDPLRLQFGLNGEQAI
jgi:hypothetical protein